jgi:putative CocE/NonD family hydrolase
MPKLHLDWYTWTLRGGPKPPFLKQRVAYYVMGAERWRYAETLEAITAQYGTYFLDSAGIANDLFSSGRLDAMPGEGAPDSYRYDPRDGYGPEVAAEALADGSSLVDQSVLSAFSGKALFYHSAPFERDTEISGFFRLSAWISIDCPDTDIYASVYVITLHGDCIRLSTDAVRARYREGLRTPRLIETRAPLRYDFERFTFISRLIRCGHRLRLVVAPMGRLIETTFAQKNYNGGGVVAEESSKDGKAVTVRLFHDEDHPSALYVPIGREEDLEVLIDNR